jgi:UDP-3-O-[3-hydroxymyristoyl] N-acetylglucosamine deacetylase
MGKFIEQKTLQGSMEFAGTALHTGDETSVRILPGDPDTGYRFQRVDIPGAPQVEANVHNISDTLLATSIGLNGASVKTVEHLLSALAGSGVDNAVIEVNGDEIPIMDGSAAPFVRGIEMVGLMDQGVAKRMLRIKKVIRAGDDSANAVLTPSEKFQVSFTIDFDHPIIGKQHMDFPYSPDAFRKEIAFARTFGMLRDVEMMHQKGLALGGSLDNAVVVGDSSVINPEGLRSPDEFVRHKILDTIGDLSLLGIPILGAYSGYRAGHAINRLLMQEVLSHPDHWELVTMEEVAPEQIAFHPIVEDGFLPASATL